jgi:hypothetical protein
MKVRGAAAFGLADQLNGAYKSGPSVFLNRFPLQLYELLANKRTMTSI